MVIPHGTILQLWQEGIDNIYYLVDFYDSLNQGSDNLRHPEVQVPDHNHGAIVGTKILVPPFVFREKSYKRLLAAWNLVFYYETVGKEIIPDTIVWDQVIKKFSE